MSNIIPFESLYSINSVLLTPFLFIGLALFLLGFYVLLFGLTVYFLCARPAVVNRRLHLGWTTVLFTLSISAALCNAAETIKEAVLSFQAAVTRDPDPLLDWLVGSRPFAILGIWTDLLYTFANCVADAILLYRYFTLWSSSWRACMSPLIVLVVTNAVGIAGVLTTGIPSLLTHYSGETVRIGEMLSTAYYFVNAGNTLLLSLIIAGRIWWLSRDSRALLGCEINRKYNKIIAMVIESGFMYSASLIIHASLLQSVSTFGFAIDVTPLIYLMVGIAPTLIILRTSLGLSDNAVPNSQMLSTLRFGEPPQTAAATGTVERSEVHTVDLQPEQGSTNQSGDIEAQKHEASSETMTASRA